MKSFEYEIYTVIPDRPLTADDIAVLSCFGEVTRKTVSPEFERGDVEQLYEAMLEDDPDNDLVRNIRDLARSMRVGDGSFANRLDTFLGWDVKPIYLTFHGVYRLMRGWYHFLEGQYWVCRNLFEDYLVDSPWVAEIREMDQQCPFDVEYVIERKWSASHLHS